MQSLASMQKLSLTDKKIFDSAYSTIKFPLAEHSFSWIYLWSGCYNDIEWAEINGNLCLFLTFDGQRCLWGPALPGKRLAATVEEALALCSSYSREKGLRKQPAVMYIPEELADSYRAIPGCRLVEQGSDYIYARQDIIGLKGEKYKNKRNLRNYFVKNFSHSVEQYSTARHRDECLALLERWRQQKLATVTGKDLKKLAYEVNANKLALGLAGQLGLKGVVVCVEGSIQGYSFGEQTSEDIFTDFFEKTNLSIKGLSAFIYGELLKLFTGSIVNAGEDWDVGYLKHAKMSYNPVQVRKSYMLVTNNVL